MYSSGYGAILHIIDDKHFVMRKRAESRFWGGGVSGDADRAYGDPIDPRGKQPTEKYGWEAHIVILLFERSFSPKTRREDACSLDSQFSLSSRRGYDRFGLGPEIIRV